MIESRPIRGLRPGLAAAVLLVLLGTALGLARLRDSRASRPDIVLVVWDTCRGDRVSVNGYPHPTTPRLAELAARGVVFRNAFSPSPWTPPAHASLFTGLLPRHHGLGERRGARVIPGIPLLAETLAKSGYETAAVVANPHLSEATGLLAGFSTVAECWTEEGVPRSGEEVRAAVERWVRSRSPRGPRRPFLLFVNLMECHLPYRFEDGAVAAVHGDGAVNGARRAAREVTVDAANRHLYGAERIDAGTIRDLGAAYDGAVRLADRATGGILDDLGAAGLLEKALVVVVGDHGENLGEHGELNHMMSVYDPVLRVPLVAAWPGRLEGGRVEEAQVRLQDLYPTLLEAAGVSVPVPCGRDARTLLEAPLRSRVLEAEYGPASDFVEDVRRLDPDLAPEFLDRFRLRWRAVREPSGTPGARKRITVERAAAGGGWTLVREEVYDPAADPGEERDLK